MDELLRGATGVQLIVQHVVGASAKGSQRPVFARNAAPQDHRRAAYLRDGSYSPQVPGRRGRMMWRVRSLTGKRC